MDPTLEEVKQALDEVARSGLATDGLLWLRDVVTAVVEDGDVWEAWTRG